MLSASASRSLTLRRQAHTRHNTLVEPQPLLQALEAQDGGVAPAVLEKLGVQPSAVLDQLKSSLDRLARASGPSQISISPRFRRVFEAAGAEAERLKDDYVSTEHFLLALADEQEAGPAGQLLRRLGVSRDRLYQALQEVRGGQRVSSPTPETTYQA